MHEAGVVISLVETVLAEMEARGIAKVGAVNAACTQASGIAVEALQSFFAEYSAGTKLAGARLAVDYRPTRLRCPGCGGEFLRSRFSFACPDCGKDGVFVREEHEFWIESLETENAEKTA